MIFSIKNDSRPWSISLRGLAVFQVWVMGGGSFFVRLWHRLLALFGL